MFEIKLKMGERKYFVEEVEKWYFSDLIGPSLSYARMDSLRPAVSKLQGKTPSWPFSSIQNPPPPSSHLLETNIWTSGAHPTLSFHYDTSFE